MYKRMKAYMEAHVTGNQVAMFQSATQRVQKSLGLMCENVKSNMLDKADGVFVSMRKDYLTLFGGVNVDSNFTMSRDERALRRNVEDFIIKGDDVFQDAVENLTKDEPADESTAKEEMDFLEDDAADAHNTEESVEEDEKEGEEEEREEDQEQDNGESNSLGSGMDFEDAADGPQSEVGERSESVEA